MQIRLATSLDELEAVYRFRYQIYVEEMNRKQKYADHAHKRICDPLDPGSHVLAAWDNGEVVGTIRINFLRETDIGEYYEFYQVNQLSYEEILNSSITTRLMIDPKYRGGTLAIRLAKELYLHCLAHGIVCDLIDCNSHLVNFFLGIGYRIHRDDLVHPEYGVVTVMKLNLLNGHHLESIRSPVAPLFRNWANKHPKPNQPQTIST